MRPAEDADLASLLEHVLDAAIELQGADFGDVQVYDADSGTLVFRFALDGARMGTWEWEASVSLEAEAKAHERVSERLELLQSELSRGLFSAIEIRQEARAPGARREFAEAARKIGDLSPREREVLDGLVRGEPHKQIAHRLGISVRTVELHRTRMLHRLGTPHLADAIRLAVLAELAAE